VVAHIRRATFSGHAEKIFVVRPASEGMIVVRVRQLAAMMVSKSLQDGMVHVGWALLDLYN
jgi:hypothetical protein